jgi:hypothetical protein
VIQLGAGTIVHVDPALPRIGGAIAVVVEQEGDNVVCHAANDPEQKTMVLLRRNVKVIGYLPDWDRKRVEVKPA